MVCILSFVLHSSSSVIQNQPL